MTRTFCIMVVAAAFASACSSAPEKDGLADVDAGQVTDDASDERPDVASEMDAEQLEEGVDAASLPDAGDTDTNEPPAEFGCEGENHVRIIVGEITMFESQDAPLAELDEAGGQVVLRFGPLDLSFVDDEFRSDAFLVDCTTTLPHPAHLSVEATDGSLGTNWSDRLTSSLAFCGATNQFDDELVDRRVDATRSGRLEYAGRFRMEYLGGEEMRQGVPLVAEGCFDSRLNE